MYVPQTAAPISSFCSKRRIIFVLVAFILKACLILFFFSWAVPSSTSTKKRKNIFEYDEDEKARRQPLIRVVNTSKLHQIFSGRESLSSLDAGVCYDDAGNSMWSPTNCPDDSYWIRLWMEARSSILQNQNLMKFVSSSSSSSSSSSYHFSDFARENEHGIRNNVDMIEHKSRTSASRPANASTTQRRNQASIFDGFDQESDRNDVESLEKLPPSSTSPAREERKKIFSKHSKLNKALLDRHPYLTLNEWFLVDVGANKGFTLSKWIESLVGASRAEQFSTPNLMKAAFRETEGPDTRHRISSMCGACCDCGDDPVDFASAEEFDRLSPLGKIQKSVTAMTQQSQQRSRQSRPVTILGLEPVKANYDFLKKFFSPPGKNGTGQSKKEDGDSHSSTTSSILRGSDVAEVSSRDPQEGEIFVDVRFAAASSAGHHGTKIKFRAGPFGVETHSFRSNIRGSSKTAATVSVVAVDKLILEEGSPYKDKYIDVLTTDTEGFDLDVAHGAKKLLSSNRVKMYVFEMHQRANYTKVFSKLESYNFECYFPAQPSAKGQRSELPHVVRVTNTGGGSAASSSSSSSGGGGNKKNCFHPRFSHLSGWMNAVCVNRIAAPELVEIFGQLTKITRKVRIPCAIDKQREAAFERAQKWLGESVT